jgi:tetratricopeptide (TPR) repeat protein
MPWLECLLFIAAAYVLVVLVRGIIQGVIWFREEFLPAPRKRNRTREMAQRQQRDSDSTTALKPSNNKRGSNGPRQSKRETPISFARLNPVSWLAPLADFARWLVFRKRYDYWVAVALGESDLVKKVKYYSRALKLDPSYEAGWKLEAVALLQLKKYAEAIDCLDKVLEIHPSATTWCRKGICCYHLNRYEEAVTCFDKALAAGIDKDAPVLEEASNCKKSAEEKIRQQSAVGRFAPQHSK